MRDPLFSTQAIEESCTKPQSLIEIFIAQQRSASTRRAYAGDLRDFFSGEPTEQELETFLNLSASALVSRLFHYEHHLRARRLKATTIGRRLATIKVFRAWAHVQINLSSLSEPKKSHENTLRPANAQKSGVKGAAFSTLALSAQVVDELVSTPGTATARGRRDTAMLRLLSEKALNRAELCALNVGDFQSEARILFVPTKGHRHQLTPMPLSLSTLKCLQLYGADLQTDGEEKPLFVNARPRVAGSVERLTIDGIYHLVRSYGKAIGVSSLTSRQLRHSAILRALTESGGDIEKAHEILPHISLNALIRYRDDGEGK